MRELGLPFFPISLETMCGFFFFLSLFFKYFFFNFNESHGCAIVIASLIFVLIQER